MSAEGIWKDVSKEIRGVCRQAGGRGGQIAWRLSCYIDMFCTDTNRTQPQRRCGGFYSHKLFIPTRRLLSMISLFYTGHTRRNSVLHFLRNGTAPSRVNFVMYFSARWHHSQSFSLPQSFQSRLLYSLSAALMGGNFGAHDFLSSNDYQERIHPKVLKDERRSSLSHCRLRRDIHPKSLFHSQ